MTIKHQLPEDRYFLCFSIYPQCLEKYTAKQPLLYRRGGREGGRGREGEGGEGG